MELDEIRAKILIKILADLVAISKLTVKLARIKFHEVKITLR